MGRKEDIVKLAQSLMADVGKIRNFGVVAHIDHGKTSMSDSLIAAAGLMSQELAGKQLFMDFYELEQERGITINAANISLVYNYENENYLLNMIDTPGHVDFGGDVIRAMRAVDGVIVVVDAVEGVMPQTETVIRQALREYCKPVLFINKVDRLINELKLNENEMRARLLNVITKVNALIKACCPQEFKDKWVVKVEDSSICFGSALHRWAISIQQMKETNIGFPEVYKYCKENRQNELAEKSPLYKAVVEMVIRHLPNPLEAQKYRIATIWKGDINSELGKGMLNCNKDSELAMMVTDVVVDPHAGEVITARVYSGTVRKGLKVKALSSRRELVVQQVGVFMGPERVNLEQVSAGNIAVLTGIKDIYAGETISTLETEPFEGFKTTVEPVMTVAIEAKKPQELSKLIDVIKIITKEDPNIVAEINPETGEHLISGMGELHLEVAKYRVEHDHRLEVNISNPIVVYHESITKGSPELLGKSPNKHNHFKISAEAMKKEMVEKLRESGLKGKIKADEKTLQKLIEIGLERSVAKKVWYVSNNCLLIDDTRGIEALHEIREMVCQAFEDAMKEGPLAKEKCEGIIVRLKDAKLHEDAIHRGPAQVLPAITRTIYACLLYSDPILLEPKQKLFINVPQDYMGAVTRELSQRRAQIEEIKTEGDSTIIIAIAPVKELIGFSSSIRSATQGRAIWTAEFYSYAVLPKELQMDVIKSIRKRKGLSEEPKTAQYFLE